MLKKASARQIRWTLLPRGFRKIFSGFAHVIVSIETCPPVLYKLRYRCKVKMYVAGQILPFIGHSKRHSLPCILFQQNKASKFYLELAIIIRSVPCATKSRLFTHHQVPIAAHAGVHDKNNMIAERNEKAEGRELGSWSRKRAGRNYKVKDSGRHPRRTRELDRLQQHDRALSHKHPLSPGCCELPVGVSSGSMV